MVDERGMAPVKCDLVMTIANLSATLDTVVVVIP